VQEAMKQPELNPYSLWQEVVVLRAATGGFLDSVEIGEVRKALENLLTRVSAEQKDLVKAIETEKKLTDEIKAQLETVIGSILTKE